jgi:N-formylmaleamate deformylase
VTPEPLSVSTNGVDLRVWRWPGPAEGRTPLVIVHGITNSGRGWDFVARDLAADRPVYAVDLRGHGESSKPERGYAAADYAADLAGAIRALALDRPVVLGHSLGARTSARFAADNPELLSALILVDPPSDHRYPAQVMDSMNAFVKAVAATRAGGADAVRAANPHWSDEQVAARVEGHQQVSERVMLDPIERYDPGTIFDDLPRITCPTLFMYGDTGYHGPGGRPGIVKQETAERAGAALRDGKVAFVAGAGHMVPWDDYAGFIAPIRAFLRSR